MMTRLEITQTALRSSIGGNWYWVRLICLILTVLVLIRRGNAQETPEELFQQALDFYAQKLYDEAEDRLQKLKTEVPEFYDKEHGSVWYLLGRVMFDKHAPEQAFQIWRQGWQWLKAARRFDPFLLTDFVHLAVIAEEPKYYQDIALAYYELLEKLNPVQHGTFLWRIYDECEFILPENLKQKFESAMQSQNQNLRPATLLKQFWRKQDLTPATLLNERLLEHLQRIEYARRHFPYRNRRGFDERGKIYVQFGQPTAKASAGTVGLDSSRENPVLYVFHPHEVWSYRFLGRHIFFPFVNFEDGRGFVLVDRIDKAIPLHFTESTRSQKGATSRIDVRIYFYNQLARSNPIFYRWVKELDEVRGDQLLANTTFMGGRTSARIRDVRAIYSTAPLDYQAENYRLDQIPDVATEVLADIDNLPVVIQTARFLQQDGTTRLEIYLALNKDALLVKDRLPLLPIDTVTVRVAWAVEDKAYWPQATHTKNLIQLDGELFREAPDTLLFQMTSLTRQNEFYVSAQVESWLSGIEVGSEEKTHSMRSSLFNPSTPEHSLLRITTFRTALQNSLNLENDKFVMSDLQISSYIEPNSKTPSPHKGQLFVRPFPFRNISKKQPLFIYFEIYGLKLNDQGQSSYRISYEIEQVKTRRSLLGKIRSLFGSRGKGQIALDSEYTGTSSTTHEWIALDLSALKKGEIKLTVKVKDLNTNEVIQRNMSLNLF